jgi:hypothetical protein
MKGVDMAFRVCEKSGHFLTCSAIQKEEKYQSGDSRPILAVLQITARCFSPCHHATLYSVEKAMPDDPRVQRLLDELLDSQATPEDVCGSCPELLPVVRERWREMCRAQSEIDALFPPLAEQQTRPAPPPAGDIPLPVIPGYEVEAVLGVGGMGVVFQARHLRLNRVIALKMLLAGAYAAPRELARFQREAEAVAGLCHANIVQIHEVGDHEGRPYFTMEFVDGGSLAQKLTGAPQPVRWAAELVASLAEAVSVAHCAGIVHRDLKPGNILLTAEGTPKISDFGLARRLKGEGDLTRTGTALGTPSYMAPEQACDTAGPVGPATDVYGLGAVLYEVLTGRPPFLAGSVLETIRQVITLEPVPPSRLNPRVPRDLETVCLKCLHKEPQRRYTSAAALAEDLRRYLAGQVVEARPVGPLERTGKWIRRNKWVAGLSAAAVFTLLAGTVVSLLFAFEARRQTHTATENAQRAKEKEEEVRRVFIASLMIPIEGNTHPLNSRLDNAEVVGLCQLRKAPRPFRVQFLESALSDPETARRVGRRADWVIQAIVGCDRALRDEVGHLLVQRIQKPDTAQEVKLACARLGQAANLDDRGWAERSADALSVALCDKGLDREDCRALAESLAGVIVHLPKAQAAEHAARVTAVFLTHLEEPVNLALGYAYFGPAIETMSPYLDAAATNRTAEKLNAILHRSEASPNAWVFLARAQLVVCQRLPPADSAAYVNRMVDSVLEASRATKEKDKFRYTFQAMTLGILSGQLDAKRASRVADAIIAMLGDGYLTGGLRTEFIESFSIPEDLARVAERLDAPGSLRAAEALIPVLKKADKLALNMEPLSKALVAVCRRLDADGSRRVAEVIAAAVQDPKTPVLARAILANGFAVVADKLEPDRAASLESGIVDLLVVDLADIKPILARRHLGQTLASVCGRPGTKSAPRAAEALTAAIRDPQTASVLLRPFAAALAVVSSQLTPEQASSHASKAAEVLGSLWIARTNNLDRVYLAQAMAEVWLRLTPMARAAQAKRMAVDLTVALQDSKTEPLELNSLAEALTAMCSQLDPAEGKARINSAEESLATRFRTSRTALPMSAVLTEALATLWLRLDRDRLPRVADTLCTALGEPDGQRYWLEFHAKLFRKVAARLDERDLERLLEQPLTASILQRAVLDVLGESKKRYFRNTWDYLDWTGSKGDGTD